MKTSHPSHENNQSQGRKDKIYSPFDYEKALMQEHIDRIMRIYNSKLTPPYEVEIQPSSRCNLSCKMCVGNSFERLEDKLDDETMRKISRDIADFEVDGFKVDCIKFSGFAGEPLVNPATIEGMRVLIDRGRKVGLFTNGLGLDGKKDGVDYLDTVCDASFLHLSLDCGSENTMRRIKGPNSDFRRVMSNLSNSVQMREKKNSELKVGVGYIIMNENSHEVYSTARMMKGIGADFVRFKVDITRRYQLDENKKMVEEQVQKALELNDENFYIAIIHNADQESLDKIGKIHSACYLNKLWGAIGSDGYLYACDHRTHGKGRPYGDLKKESFGEVWSRKKDDVPDDLCVRCSPFAERINPFIDSLFKGGIEELVKLKKNYLE